MADANVNTVSITEKQKTDKFPYLFPLWIFLFADFLTFLFNILLAVNYPYKKGTSISENSLHIPVLLHFIYHLL